MVTDEQIAALKRIIFSSSGDANAMRLAVFLIDQSEQLTKDVCVRLVAPRDGFNECEISTMAHYLHYMAGDYHNKHIHDLLVVAGSNLRFSCQFGDLNVNKTFIKTGQFMMGDGIEFLSLPQKKWYTFFLAQKPYSCAATMVRINHEELNKIQIESPMVRSSLNKVQQIERAA